MITAAQEKSEREHVQRDAKERASADARRKKEAERNTAHLYHQTDRESAARIASSGKMLRGSDGLAGGGIYFADSPRETNGKAHRHGVMIKCEVDRGKVKSVGHSGDSSITHRSLKREGYDSVKISRPGGDETVVYNYGQVRVVGYTNN